MNDYAQSPAPQPSLSGSQQDSKLLLILAAAAQFFVGFLGPLVGWLVLKDKDPHAGEQLRLMTNGSISWCIWMIVAGVSILLLVGFVLAPVAVLLNFIWVVISIIKAAGDEPYKWPMSLELIK